MSDGRLTILLIEDDVPDATLIREMLADAQRAAFEVECVERLAQGIKRLRDGGIDAVLIDLSLPDSHGIETFRKVRHKYTHVASLILTGMEDETVAIQAIQEGAQDYLIKDHLAPAILERAILYAVERQRVDVQLNEQTQILQAILTSMVDGVVVVDNDGKSVVFNPAAETMMGFRPGDEVSQSEWPERYGGMFLPDKKTPHPPHSLPLSQAREGRKVKDQEIFFQHALHLEGIFASVSASPVVDEQGRRHGAVAIARDITVAKATAEQNRILHTEMQQRIRERNEEFEAFGYRVNQDFRKAIKRLEQIGLALRQKYARTLDEEGRDHIKTVLAAAAYMNKKLDTLVELSRTPRTEARRILGLSEERHAEPNE